MASRIKGITVEIGGDTTGLDKALKSVKLIHQKDPVRSEGCIQAAETEPHQYRTAHPEAELQYEKAMTEL